MAAFPEVLRGLSGLSSKFVCNFLPSPVTEEIEPVVTASGFGDSAVGEPGRTARCNFLPRRCSVMGSHAHRAMALAVLLLACLPGKAVGSVERTELRDDELRTVIETLQGLELFKKATARTEDQRMFLVSSSKYRVKEDGKAEKAVAEVVYFRYEGGITIRATLDLGTNELLKLEELKAYPTPLAEEESTEAIRLAKEQSPAVRALYAANGEKDVKIEKLVPVISNPEDPRYGHRLVILMFGPKSRPEGVVKVAVDLTLRTAGPLEPVTENPSRGARP